MTRRRVGAFIVVTASLAACGAFTSFELGAEHIVVSDPQGFVREARALMGRQGASADGGHELIDEARLPPSLRVPKVVLPRGAFLSSVLEAHVASDHLDLVLIRHTDGYQGARVWAAAARQHRDAPTRYADIYLFTCKKEEPEGEGNVC